MKVIVSSKPIEQAAEKAFRDSVLLLGREFTKAISDPVYAWPNGETPRDIVDTGTLRRSQKHRFQGPLTAIYLWDVSYSAAVHNGAVLRNGTTLPARRWTDRAFKKFDLERVFGQLYRRYSK